MNDTHFLHRLFLNNAEKRCHKWIHYFDIYERHFGRFRGKSPTMLEIGVSGGGSLAMWRAYLGPKSKIIGLDIDPKCKEHEVDGIDIFIGSQDDVDTLDAILVKYPCIDIVLDDGSHINRHITASFEILYPRISSNGIYMVEDTHACYWRSHEGGLKCPGSFIEYAKNKTDELNAVHISNPDRCDDAGMVPVSQFTRSTDYIAFYDSVVVFEKRPQGRRQAYVTGPMEIK